MESKILYYNKGVNEMNHHYLYEMPGGSVYMVGLEERAPIVSSSGWFEQVLLNLLKATSDENI